MCFELVSVCGYVLYVALVCGFGYKDWIFICFGSSLFMLFGLIFYLIWKFNCRVFFHSCGGFVGFRTETVNICLA